MEFKQIEKSEIDRLINQLRSRDPIARLRAVSALSTLKDYKIVDPLIAVALNDNYLDVKNNAINCVTTLKTIISNLMEGDLSIRDAAAKSLQKIDKIIWRFVRACRSAGNDGGDERNPTQESSFG